MTARLLVAGDADRELWHAVRSGGATASDAHKIAHGGIDTHRKLIEDKLNERRFRGNSHTARGNAREPELLHFADRFISPCVPNTALWGSAEHRAIMATPDGFGEDLPRRGRYGVEVKSHDAQWDSDEIPADHYDQMQVGMFVWECDWWLYVYEVMGEDGEPTLEDPLHIWVPRDEDRIARLVGEMLAFLAWWAAGAPARSDIPDEIDGLLARDVAAQAVEKRGKTERAAVRSDLDAWLAEQAGKTVRAAGTRGSILRTAEDVKVLDTVAWAASGEGSWDEYEEALQVAADARAAAEALATEAIKTYHRSEVKYGPVRITPTKGTK